MIETGKSDSGPWPTIQPTQPREESISLVSQCRFRNDTFHLNSLVEMHWKQYRLIVLFPKVNIQITFSRVTHAHNNPIHTGNLLFIRKHCSQIEIYRKYLLEVLYEFISIKIVKSILHVQHMKVFHWSRMRVTWPTHRYNKSSICRWGSYDKIK